ncbi:MAG: DUF1844 domain-containing protein [Bacteroidetes bacterium]|nr:DUF1844 domain-containing protein [Bacteroidota bacterium]
MNTPSEKSTLMFATLVSMFSTQAMMAMGKLANPATGRVDRNLQGAQFMIDMLEVVDERTQGNLTSDEARMLSAALSDLRLNYVAEMQRDANPASPAADTVPPELDADGTPDNVA